MRLLTAISIVSLVVSIAAVVFVLGLYGELEKSESDAPPMNLSERQVISLVKDEAYRCWYRDWPGTNNFTISNFTQSESASFRPGGIWVVESTSSWTSTSGRWSGPDKTRIWKVTTTDHGPFGCLYMVDDSTGKVLSKAGEN